MKRNITIITVIALLLPIVTFAADFSAGIRPDTTPGVNGLNKITTVITAVMAVLWIFFIAFAVIMFIVAGFHFLAARGEGDGIEKARKALLWGSIGVAIAVMAFAIPFFIRNTVSPAQAPLPELQNPQGGN